MVLEEIIILHQGEGNLDQEKEINKKIERNIEIMTEIEIDLEKGKNNLNPIQNRVLDHVLGLFSLQIDNEIDLQDGQISPKMQAIV